MDDRQLVDTLALCQSTTFAGLAAYVAGGPLDAVAPLFLTLAAGAEIVRRWV